MAKNIIISQLYNIHLALRVLFHSIEENIVISWNFIVGAFIGFFCRIFFLKRTILSINMLSHERKNLNKIIRRLVYNNAFKYPKFYATVNSEELIDSYSNTFVFNKSHFFVLPDCIRHEYENALFTEGNGKIFYGGEAIRDWIPLFNAAKLLPELKLIGIARKMVFDSKLEVPNNVEMYYDTNHDFFNKQLKDSSKVAMPL